MHHTHSSTEPHGQQEIHPWPTHTELSSTQSVRTQKYAQPSKNHQQTRKEPNHLALTINQIEFKRITYKGNFRSTYKIHRENLSLVTHRQSLLPLTSFLFRPAKNRVTGVDPPEIKSSVWSPCLSGLLGSTGFSWVSPKSLGSLLPLLDRSLSHFVSLSLSSPSRSHSLTLSLSVG
jgi:hypothetical protein